MANNKQMTSLTDFPSEIIICILEHVTHQPHLRKSIVNVACTSKRISSLLEPLIYADIHLDSSQHLPPLIFRLLTRPDLAALVRGFEIDKLSIGPSENFHDQNAIVDEDDWAWETYQQMKAKNVPWYKNRRGWPESLGLGKLLRESISHMCDQEADAKAWYFLTRSLQKPGASDDAVLALLLSVIPGLQRFHLGRVDHYSYHWIGYVLRRSASLVYGQSRPLHQLDTVMLGRGKLGSRKLFPDAGSIANTR